MSMPHANLPALHGPMRGQAGAPSLPSPKRLRAARPAGMDMKSGAGSQRKNQVLCGPCGLCACAPKRCGAQVREIKWSTVVFMESTSYLLTGKPVDKILSDACGGEASVVHEILHGHHAREI